MSVAGFAMVVGGRAVPRASQSSAKLLGRLLVLDACCSAPFAVAPVAIADEAVARAADADAAVLFLYDAHLYKSNQALLEAVPDTHVLRDPTRDLFR